MHEPEPSLTADEIARRLTAQRVAPACAAACAIEQGEARQWQCDSGGDTDLFFDLASVTKPFTAVAFARTGIDRRTPLAELLPEVRGTQSERTPIELLLAHRAGLEGHVALYAPLLRGDPLSLTTALCQAADSRRPAATGDPPVEGFDPQYSDLGYILAGAALARAIGECDAGAAIERLVLEPLGIERFVGTIRDLRSRGINGAFASTEEVDWRGGRVTGAVHDENAWAMTALGGSGHAGLFGRVAGVVSFACTVLEALNGHGPFGSTDLEWLARRRPGGSLRAGFDGKSVEGSSAGSRLGPESFGHLGFTGTSLWIDPQARIVVSLLTNRIFMSRDNEAIRSARPWTHDALWQRARNMR